MAASDRPDLLREVIGTIHAHQELPDATGEPDHPRSLWRLELELEDAITCTIDQPAPAKPCTPRLSEALAKRGAVRYRLVPYRRIGQRARPRLLRRAASDIVRDSVHECLQMSPTGSSSDSFAPVRAVRYLGGIFESYRWSNLVNRLYTLTFFPVLTR